MFGTCSYTVNYCVSYRISYIVSQVHPTYGHTGSFSSSKAVAMPGTRSSTNAKRPNAPMITDVTGFFVPANAVDGGGTPIGPSIDEKPYSVNCAGRVLGVLVLLQDLPHPCTCNEAQ